MYGNDFSLLNPNDLSGNLLDSSDDDDTENKFRKASTSDETNMSSQVR